MPTGAPAAWSARLARPIGGGVAHFLFEVLDIAAQVVADEIVRALRIDLDQHAVAAGGVGDDVVDVALDAFGRDAVLDVEGVLLVAAAVGLGDGAFHAAGHPVGIEDHPAIEIGRAHV